MTGFSGALRNTSDPLAKDRKCFIGINWKLRSKV